MCKCVQGGAKVSQRRLCVSEGLLVSYEDMLLLSHAAFITHGGFTAVHLRINNRALAHREGYDFNMVYVFAGQSDANLFMCF